MRAQLPTGLIVLDFRGLVVEYLPSDEDALRPEEVVGHSFIDEILKGSEAREFREIFLDFVGREGQTRHRSLRMDIERSGIRTRCLLALIRSPLPGRALLSVATLAHPDLPMTARLHADSVSGSLADAAGLRVVVANADLWKAVIESGEKLPKNVGFSETIGRKWGEAHAVRVESFVQRKTLRTLRELELETALEYLSGSLAVVGLGRFETNLGRRHEGLIIVDHYNSPFPELLPGLGNCCGILEGFHSGLFSYLSGRRLRAMELCCVSRGKQLCRFMIGVEERLEILFRRESAADVHLLRELEEEVP